MDIGSLTGAITIEDQLSGVMVSSLAHVRHFKDEFEGMTGAVLVGAGVIAGAITGAVASVVALGEKGSVINGVEDAFNHLAIAAGSTGDALIRGLDQGVRGTIDSMELMQSTTRLLSSGMKLTEADMRTMGATAREMGKATGTDAAQGLNTLSQALLTGNTRSLKRFGINVDLIKSEKDFAASLGTTRDQLSAAGQMEAHRIAMLEGMRQKLNALGESQLTFKERIQQSTVAVGNWFDDLAKGVAKSSAVNRAFDTIATTLSKTFGGASQTLLQTILSGVDKLADGITSIAPKVIGAIDTIKNKIIDIWNWLVDFNDRWQITNNLIAGAKVAWGVLEGAFNLVRGAVMAVVEAWRTMPDWLKRITQTALEGAAAAGIYAAAIGATAAPLSAMISMLDLTINILGNLTGAVYSVSQLYKPFATYVGDVTTAFRLWKVAVLEATAAMGINAVVTRSLALGKVFLLTSLVNVVNAIGAFNRAIGVTAAVEAAAATTSGILSAAKLFLGRVVLAVSINYNVLLARIGLTGAAMAASTVTTGILTAAMTALGVALLAVQYVLIPLAIAWGAWKFGEWLGSFPSVQRAVIWLAEHLHLISTEAANAKRAMLDMNTAWPKATPSAGFFSIDPAVASIQKSVLAVGIQLGKTGDELDRFVDDAVQRFYDLKDNGGSAVQILTSQLGALEGTANTSALRKIAEDAKRLQASGAVLTPQLQSLVELFGDVGEAAGAGSGGMNDFLKHTDTLGDKIQSLLKGWREAGVELAAFEGAFRRLTPAQKDNFTVQQMLVPEMDKLIAAHRALTPEMQRVYDATTRTRLAYLAQDDALLAASGPTLAQIDNMKLLGMTEKDIASQYKVSTDALTRRVAAMQKAQTQEQALAAFSEAYAEQERQTAKRREDAAMAADKVIADSRAELNGLLRQQTTTTIDFEISKIHEEETARIAGSKLQGDALREFSNIQKQISAARVSALMRDNDKLVNSSQKALDQIAQKSHATYEAMLASNAWAKLMGFPPMYAQVVIDAEQRIARADAMTAAGIIVDWQKLNSISRTTLQSIAQTAQNTYQEMLAANAWAKLMGYPPMYSQIAVQEQHKIAEAAVKDADTTRTAWSVAWDKLKVDLKQIGLSTAHDIASSIAEGIKTGDFSQFENNLRDALAKGIGQAAAAAVNLIAPGLGTALEPLFESLSDKLMGALGLGTKGRDLVREFAKGFQTFDIKTMTFSAGGGFEELHKKLLQLSDPAYGEALWKALTQGVGRNNPEQAKAVIEEIRKALQDLPGPVSMAEQAASAGFQTIATLRTAADQAVALWEYMRDSGLYSADTVQKAWQRAQDALIEAGDEGAKAWQKARDEITKLDEQIKGLQQSIAAEAPELEMGVIERQQRDQLAALQAQRDAAQEAMDAAAQGAVDGAHQAADEFLNGFRDAAASAEDLMKSTSRHWFDNAAADAGAAMDEVADVVQSRNLQADVSVTADTSSAAAAVDALSSAVAGHEFKAPVGLTDETGSMLTEIGSKIDSTKFDAHMQFDNVEGATRTASEQASRIIDDVLKAHEFVARLRFQYELPENIDVNAVVTPQYMAGGGTVQAVDWAPRGTDVVPVMLSPGERVTPEGQGGDGGKTVVVNNYFKAEISAVDGASVRRMVEDPDFADAWVRVYQTNSTGIRSGMENV